VSKLSVGHLDTKTLWGGDKKFKKEIRVRAELEGDFQAQIDEINGEKRTGDPR